MKKLMVAVAAVAMAACAQAAAISWSSGAMNDHTGTLLNKSTAYTAVCSFYTYDGEKYTDVSDKMGGTLTVTTSTKQGVYGAATASSGIDSGTYYAKLVITGNAGGAGDGWSIESDYTEVVYDAAAYAGPSVNFQNAGTLVNTGTNYGWQSVPEPTSGLLLLLGVAGLALRRRRA